MKGQPQRHGLILSTVGDPWVNLPRCLGQPAIQEVMKPPVAAGERLGRWGPSSRASLPDGDARTAHPCRCSSFGGGMDYGSHQFADGLQVIDSQLFQMHAATASGQPHACPRPVPRRWWARSSAGRPRGLRPGARSGRTGDSQGTPPTVGDAWLNLVLDREDTSVGAALVLKVDQTARLFLKDFHEPFFIFLPLP